MSESARCPVVAQGLPVIDTVCCDGTRTVLSIQVNTVLCISRTYVLGVVFWGISLNINFYRRSVRSGQVSLMTVKDSRRR